MADARPKPRVISLRRTTAAWRRHLVCMMFLSGQHTTETICQELKERYDIKVSESTVTADIYMMRGLYKDRAVETIQEMVDREVQKLDLLENIAAEHAAPSSYILGLDDADGEDVVAALEKAADEAQNRDNKFVDQMLKIQDRRSRLLGLDKPTRVELSGKDGGPMQVLSLTDAELERIAAGGNK